MDYVCYALVLCSFIFSKERCVVLLFHHIYFLQDQIFETMAYSAMSVSLGLSISFIVTAIASVIFRFEARRLKHLRLRADDWTILVALVHCCLPPVDAYLALAHVQ